MEIMQGDQYIIPFKITDENGTITDDSIKTVEIVMGTLQKSTPDVFYMPDVEMWAFPLTQEESFSILDGVLKVQVRIAFNSGDVVGSKVQNIYIHNSMSLEVL